MNKTIVSEFFTTVSSSQAKKSFASLTYRVLNLQVGEDTKILRSRLKTYFGYEGSVYTFYNARIALYQFLISNKKHATSEIILSGYNCSSVTNAVIQAGFKPIYADIENETLGLDATSLEALISPNTEYIVLQHTFGMPARDTHKIIALAKKHDIYIIEDVAHSLGVTLDNKKLGTLGDAAIFSTGRDKVISSVNGGILLINSKKLKIPSGVTNPSALLTVKNHLYNIFGYLAFKSYDFFKLGRIIMAFAKKIKMFPVIVTDQEKNSTEKNLHYKLPNSLAYLMQVEFTQLQNYTNIRKKHQQYYINNLDPKFTILDSKNIGNAFRVCLICKTKEERHTLFNYLKRHKVLLGTSWTDINIAPRGTNLKRVGYEIGECPISENIASRLLFLPSSYTHTPSQIKNTCDLLNTYGK